MTVQQSSECAMRLTEQQRKVIAACETEGDFTLAEIAARVALPQHTVRRALDRLESNQIIKRRVYVNSFLIGTAPYLIALSLSVEGRQQEHEMEAFLAKRPEVSFMSRVSDKYDLLIEVRCRAVYDVHTFLHVLAGRFPRSLDSKHVLAVTSLLDLPVLATLSERRKLAEFQIGVVNRVVPLDDLDRQILTLLTYDWRDSSAKLAKKCGAPLSTIDYRLQRLRSQGVIVGTRYWIDVEQLGLSTFYHFVSTKGFGEDCEQRMKAIARNNTCVHTFRCFIGSWDYLFECHYGDPRESLKFVEQLCREMSDEITRVSSVAVVRHRKVSDCTVSSVAVT
jgi:DNA-binding Lrp family transcriptional regulator